MNYQAWTEADEKYLRDNYKGNMTQDIKDRFGSRSVNAVRTKCKRLGLTNKPVRLNVDDIHHESSTENPNESVERIPM